MQFVDTKIEFDNKLRRWSNEALRWQGSFYDSIQANRDWAVAIGFGQSVAKARIGDIEREQERRQANGTPPPA